MFHAVGSLRAKGEKVAVVKIDCLDTEDDKRYAKLKVRDTINRTRKRKRTFFTKKSAQGACH
jgi:Ni2+-binding GTPase involved in maturation of urease and hydrogenase